MSDPRIGIVGSFGLNVGDEAILGATIASLRQVIPEAEIVVFSRDPRHTAEHHRGVKVEASRGTLRTEVEKAIAGLDLLVVGGGGLLYDGEAEEHLYVAGIAQARGQRTATWAIGAGPLSRVGDRTAVAQTLNKMQLLTVRDRPTQSLLEAVGVTREITQTADPALLLRPLPFSRSMLQAEGISSTGPLIGISVREPGGAAPEIDGIAYHRVLACAADYAVERFDADVVFIPMEAVDYQHIARVVACMGKPARALVLHKSYSPARLLGLTEHLELAVGMRLHFAIFAALSHVPVVALPYAAKVTGFLELFGGAPPKLEERRWPGVLLAHLDDTWHHRQRYAAQLAAVIPALQERAGRTATMIADLLGIQRPAGAETEEGDASS
jgi:polysaccharide pyruvyl transferase CsaB